MKRLDDISYTYRSLSVPGGGFVTGFVFHPKERGILYARTDIGGVYRFDFNARLWVSLADHLTDFTHHLAQPISLALDAERPDVLYAMCGNNRKGSDWGRSALLISEDKGVSFTEKTVPFACNGNAPARSTAERLICRNGVLWYGSQWEGLWRSDDNGDSWERLPFPEEEIAFVFIHPEKDIMVVSCSGQTLAEGGTRGHTLYISYDLTTFRPLEMPSPINDERCDHNGFVGCGVAYGDSVYISFTHSFKTGWGGWNDYACDNGGGFDGRLWRYDIIDGRLVFGADITPDIGFCDPMNEKRRLPFGLGGVDTFGESLAVCSIGGRGDGVFITRDGGNSYEVIKSIELSRFRTDVPYLKPEYNGGRAPLHWMSSLRINPHDPDLAVFNTGTGVYALCGVTTDEPYISTMTCGMEETVHMNIYAANGGRNQVVTLVGDLGGFAFSETDRPCENSFADENGDRYITCLNADIVASAPDTFVTTARGNWTGETKGGVILTHDGGETFTHIGYPTGISERLDEVIESIKRPNVNSGWTAISADGDIILWTLAYKWMELPCFAAVRYDVKSGVFTKVRIFDKDGCDISDSDTAMIKIFSDRLDKERFYGFGEAGQLYYSVDKGETFRQCEINGGFPVVRMSGIDGGKGCEIRFHPYESGVCYAALIKQGLWRLSFSGSKVQAEGISDEGDYVKTVGYGKGITEGVPALYSSGVLFGEYGFWRSDDLGTSWARINTDSQMYSGIISMDGDLTRRGRVYIATGGRGGFYGDEV